MKSSLPLFRPLARRCGLRAEFVLLLLAAMLCARAPGESVVNSVHNLAVGGPGSVKAVSEKNVCVFCHTVHRASGAMPLWNHTLSSVSNYIVYGSARLTSLDVSVPQPNGSSRLCLSCHDGTVALGNVSSGAAQIQMQNGVTTMPAGANNLGTDLSRDHPVSFVYDAALAARDPEVKDPSHLPATVKLDSQSRLQCTACHNPHDNQFGNFLVMDNTGSALCTACHQPTSWLASQHAAASTLVPATLSSKLPVAKPSRAAATPVKSMTMSAIGCANCHVNHNAGSRKHMLQADAPEQNCLNCHNGTTAKKNVAADFNKPSLHPITLNSQTHSPVEDVVNPETRHVVCADCHDPHASTTAPAVVPNASGALANVAGVTLAGGIIKPLLKEYELCFRCHGDSLARGPATVSRVFSETNTRLQFSAGNQSYHPVTAIGRNPTGVPSLIQPWTVNSLMYCTDCHNSDSSSKAGGSGADGPHGSVFTPILERQLLFTDNNPESPGNYALCYKCHSRSSILADQSFRAVNSLGQDRGHRFHVVDQKTACTTCHDSHGVVDAAHLINFNLVYVSPSTASGTINYQSTGIYNGNCTLTCHGFDHNASAYPTPSAASAAKVLRGRRR
ncbi:MAG: hypothetical protein EPO07_02685 [Verrucomicrobia bacterium]|nr:MAG: hypothetical protein EPO07_02685 [Verrucomicrobiota bacterium]